MNNEKKTLIPALLSLAASFNNQGLSRGNQNVVKTDGRKKTKKGATHIIGKHFKPRYLIFIDGKPVTPAMYRRMHMGVQNPRKQNGSKSTH